MEGEGTLITVNKDVYITLFDKGETIKMEKIN